MSRTGAQLKAAISFNERVAEWGAGFVVVGLAFEVFFASVFHEPPETYWSHWGPVGSDVVVTLGVAAEVLFGRRQRIASDELALLSERNVAAAMERASLAEQAAAEARERTADIEKLTAFRRLSIEQKNSLVRALKPHASALWAWIEHENSDVEAFTYARDMASVISASCLRPPNFMANGHPMRIIFGVVIEDITPGQVGLAAFNAAGISYGEWDGDRCSAPHRKDASGKSPNLYIWVGPKLPPELEAVPPCDSSPTSIPT